MRDYKEKNQDQIAKNRHKINEELLELEDIMSEEKKVAEKARAEMVAAEKAEKLQMAKNKEKLIDDLMFSEGDAGAIVADHQSKIAVRTSTDCVNLVFTTHASFCLQGLRVLLGLQS